MLLLAKNSLKCLQFQSHPVQCLEIHKLSWMLPFFQYNLSCLHLNMYLCWHWLCQSVIILFTNNFNLIFITVHLSESARSLTFNNVAVSLSVNHIHLYVDPMIELETMEIEVISETVDIHLRIKWAWHTAVTVWEWAEK